MKRTPYTTRSGLQIGICYEPPRRYETSADMDRLQSALIGRGKPIWSLKEWGGYLTVLGLVLVAALVTNCMGA